MCIFDYCGRGDWWWFWLWRLTIRKADHCDRSLGLLKLNAIKLPIQSCCSSYHRDFRIEWFKEDPGDFSKTAVALTWCRQKAHIEGNFIVRTLSICLYLSLWDASLTFHLNYRFRLSITNYLNPTATWFSVMWKYISISSLWMKSQVSILKKKDNIRK